MQFEHRESESDDGILDHVWRTRSASAVTMTSVARTCFHLILSTTAGRVSAGLRGPETRATTVPVPPETEYLGVRFSFGSVLLPHPSLTMVDGFAPLPMTDSGKILVGGEQFEAPTFDNVEHFVRQLKRYGLVVPSTIEDDFGSGRSDRTRQRRFRALTGLSRSKVAQIDRTNTAALMLRGGAGWAAVADTMEYFDQAHLAHDLRRYVGHTARELQNGGFGPMSFLYKTRLGVGS